MRMCGVVALLVYARAAVAQPVAVPASASEEATASFEAGRKLLAGHHPAEACARFSHALELEPGNVGVILNLGLCNEQLDKLATALAWFRGARARAAELGLAEAVRAAGDKTAQLSRTVATVRLTLSPPAAVATVTVDGTAVAASDLGRVELDAGHHVIEVAAAGGAVAREAVDVVDGRATSVVLVVPPAQRPGPQVTAPEAAAKPAITRRRPAYLLGALGGGLVLGSVALGLAGRSAVRSTDHPDVQQRWKVAVMYGGTSLFALGAATLGWATWTYLQATSEHGDRTIVAPIVGDRSLGVEVRGAF